MVMSYFALAPFAQGSVRLHHIYFMLELSVEKDHMKPRLAGGIRTTIVKRCARNF